MARPRRPSAGEQASSSSVAATRAAVVHGALNAATGDFAVAHPRAQSPGRLRSRSSKPSAKCVPDVPKPARLATTRRRTIPNACRPSAAAASSSQITIAWLPFRAPELMPCEDLWRLTKAVVAANPVYEVEALAEHAVDGSQPSPPYERLRQSGLLSSKFQ